MKSFLLLIALASACFALSPKERELVQGLTQINKDLRAQITQNEAAISQKDTDYLFLKEKNEAQSARLENVKKLASEQEQDLALQDAKIKEQEQKLDTAIKERDAAKKVAAEKTKEAHDNASERDVFVWAFAMLAATAVCYGLFPVVNKVLNITFPWTLAWIPAWGILLGIFYGIERFALSALVKHL
jgi:cation transport ATPase